MLKFHYLGGDTKSVYEHSTLASEIRNKHNEYTSRRFVRKELRAYESSMEGLDVLATQINRDRERLNIELSKISYEGKKDDKIVISNELKWNFRQYFSLKLKEFQGKKWLVNDRLIQVSEGVSEEFDEFLLPFGNSHKCYNIMSLVKRYECEEGKKATSEPVPIIDLVRKHRLKYYDNLKDDNS